MEGILFMKHQREPHCPEEYCLILHHNKHIYSRKMTPLNNCYSVATIFMPNDLSVEVITWEFRMRVDCPSPKIQTGTLTQLYVFSVTQLCDYVCVNVTLQTVSISQGRMVCRSMTSQDTPSLS